MTDALDGDAVSASLARDWGLRAPTIERHDLGMNSRTWIVSDGARRSVAKAVPADVQPNDVASAVMYVGGRQSATALLDAYLAERVIPASEVERALEPMLQLRWAVQADYFARRLATDDLTGISSSDENQVGLDDARRGLLG